MQCRAEHVASPHGPDPRRRVVRLLVRLLGDSQLLDEIRTSDNGGEWGNFEAQPESQLLYYTQLTKKVNAYTTHSRL